MTYFLRMKDSIEIPNDYSSIQALALSKMTFERKSTRSPDTHYKVV